MFILPPTPKQLTQLQANGNSSFPCPDTWEEFAPMLTIKSGKSVAPFNPYPYQVEINNLIDRYRYAMIAKGRQQGLSEFCLSKILFEMLRTPSFNAVAISKTGWDAYKLGNRMILMLDSLNLPTKRKSAAEIVLKNGSRVVFTYPGDAAARGEMSVGFLLVDEFSHIKEAELTLSSALPALAMVDDAICMLVFTPNGKQHYSFKLLNECNPENMDLIGLIKCVREGTAPPLYHFVDTSGWCKILLHWRAHPKYAKESDFLRITARTKKIPWKKVLREYDLSFDEAEMQYIPDKDIDACAIGEYKEFDSENDADCRYYAGLDASSVGADYFCFAILEERRGILNLVHLYRARRRSMKRHLVRIGEICQQYPIHAAQVETNSFGQIYYEELSSSYREVNWQRFTASTRSNIEIFERMLIRMEERTLIYPKDSIVLRELRGLEQDPTSGRIEAASTGNTGEEEDELHDDIPRAIALAINAWEDRPSKGGIDPEALKAALRKPT